MWHTVLISGSSAGKHNYECAALPHRLDLLFVDVNDFFCQNSEYVVGIALIGCSGASRMQGRAHTPYDPANPLWLFQREHLSQFFLIVSKTP